MASCSYDTNELDSNAKNIELWKIKKLIKNLEEFRGNGTSMISILLPPNYQIPIMTKKLNDELGAAQNIKSRVNRQSVITAIMSVQAKFKLYNRVPPNGLVIYCGEIVTDDGKEKKVNIDFEPFRPIQSTLYLCDNKFHTEALNALLADDSKYGFIIIDGNGALFGLLHGNTKEVVSKFSVDLPKKHGRGGQSAPRFGRIRLEKRHHYILKVAETAVQIFISNDKVNVNGIILAGSADFKTELSESDAFDQRLQTKILKVVDISYGDEQGFNQAINLAADCLQNVKFIHEKKTLNSFFDHIARDDGFYCFGVKDLFKALEAGAVDTIIIWEYLELVRYKLKNSTNDDKIIYLKPEEEKNKDFFNDNGVECEVMEKGPLIDWLIENYQNYGSKLEVITDCTTEGSQFCKGFGGLGGILRYKQEFQFEDESEIYDDIYEDDY